MNSLTPGGSERRWRSVVATLRWAADDLLEALELSGHLGLDVFRIGLGGRAARVADEASVPVDERVGRGEWLAQREVDVNPHPDPGVARAGELFAVDVGGDQHGRARHDAVTMRVQDARAHAGREAEIIGVDDQTARHARVPCTMRRSTVAGTPRANAPSTSRLRMCSSRSYPMRGNAWTPVA